MQSMPNIMVMPSSELQLQLVMPGVSAMLSMQSMPNIMVMPCSVLHLHLAMPSIISHALCAKHVRHNVHAKQPSFQPS
eukprot:1150518-Pelagomonas_calceolata.AAC.3